MDELANLGKNEANKDINNFWEIDSHHEPKDTINLHVK